MPGLVANTPNVRALAAGEGHTCSISDDALHCWGRNSEGEFGSGMASEFGIYGEGTTRLPDISDLAANANYTCALDRDGRVQCWGSGALGSGFQGSQPKPTSVSGWP
jgi:alpha-tubulin suppressor-like RCC1 family protein